MREITNAIIWLIIDKMLEKINLINILKIYNINIEITVKKATMPITNLSMTLTCKLN